MYTCQTFLEAFTHLNFSFTQGMLSQYTSSDKMGIKDEGLWSFTWGKTSAYLPFDNKLQACEIAFPWIPFGKTSQDNILNPAAFINILLTLINDKKQTSYWFLLSLPL